jgi:predicted ATP-grasp superfamily ATP-dependent carboligase
MKILLAEYASHHAETDPSLALEGRAMLSTLQKSFERAGHTVCSPSPGTDFESEIRRIGSRCDNGLVIAPDDMLFSYTKTLEDVCRNIGCNSISVAICANKQKSGNSLAGQGIDVPREVTSGKRVIKDISGAGALHMKYADEEPLDAQFGQEYISGEHLSVSLIVSRVTGEVCLYYTGEGPLLLAVNRQDIRIEDNGQFLYCGGETPITHPRHHEIVSIAKKTVLALGCQGYIGIDLVVSPDRIVVVDVNPRPTGSLIGIAQCISEEIASLILDASYGKQIGPVTYIHRVTFDKSGSVSIIDSV